MIVLNGLSEAEIRLRKLKFLFDFYLKIRYAGILNKTTGRFCQLIRMFLMKYQGIWILLILNISTLI